MNVRQTARASLAVCFILVLTIVQFAVLGLAITGCLGSDSDEILFGHGNVALDGTVPCTVSETRYPTTQADMSVVYAGRTFYVDGNHLGHDVKLPEGTAIYAVGCGVIRFYGPATGYGQLVVVVEHKLDKPLVVTNGMGEQVTIVSFLSIYGHLRKSSDRDGKINVLPYQVGQMVGPNDVIGYVNDDAHNGDGAEHVHLGFRLQNLSAAKTTDSKWFRGYDGSPSQRKWFADPVLFLAALTSANSSVVWHPAGTVLRSGDDSYWMVGHDDTRQVISMHAVLQEKLSARSVATTDAELGCLQEAGSYVSPREGHGLIKFDDASTVYEYTGLGVGQWRMAFISYEAFQSWGWTDADIVVRPAAERPGFFSQTEDHGLRVMRDGSLVKTPSDSEVSVVSEGAHLPILDWATFLSMGYAEEQIAVVPQENIDAVAGPRGALITPELLGVCAHPSTCVGDDCEPGTPGGGLGEGGAGGGSDGGAGAGAGSEGGSGGGNSSTGVPYGKVLFQFSDDPLSGVNEFQAMWDPPGPSFYDWGWSTFALCPDTVPGDGKLECLLDMPSGTVNFLFQVKLPDASWWGDMSYDPQGGKGNTNGTVTLTGPNGNIPYVMVTNGTGPLYMNGLVSVIP